MSSFAVRDHRPSILVAALSSAFGVALLDITGALATLATANDQVGSSGTLRLFLAVLALVFIAIATYVGAVVTANTFATIIAGRTRTIALMRLIGATARSQRHAVAKEGLIVGLIGSATGALLGTTIVFAIVTISELTGFIPTLGYDYFDAVILVPLVSVVLTTWLASWVGSRRVLTVSPMQATGAALDASLEEISGHRGRRAAAIVLLVLGAVLLAFGVLVGLINPGGVLIGVVGGMLSFTGLVLGAQFIMPPVLRLVGRMLGSSPASRLAAENAVRYPERSARTTIGLVIGVTLITMFAVAASTYQEVIKTVPALNGVDVDQLVLVTVVIFSVLIGFSALLAAVGMVNNLSLSVLQRTRELGLLRALGFTAHQLRGMIRAESAQLSIASILTGLVLGIGYGWAGAQSLLGAIAPPPGLVLPVVPVWLVVAVVVVAALLTIAASAVPARRATAVSPVAALALE